MTGILINGEEKETISIYDRGFQYGDGLFETMSVTNGIIPLWPSHWVRLSEGCSRLSITLPDKKTIENEIALLVGKTNQEKCVVKLIVTRGTGERGYRFNGNQNTCRVISCHSWPDYPESYQDQGVAVRYCETTISQNVKLAGIKHLNRLEQILARNEWDTDDFQEGLMLSNKGFVIDGTMSNIFMVKNNIIYTPDLSDSGVSGVMRKTIIHIAQSLKLSVNEKTITKNELKNADELFLTNSLFGIWPIKSLGTVKFSPPGNITLQLQQELKRII